MEEDEPFRVAAYTSPPFIRHRAQLERSGVTESSTDEEDDVSSVERDPDFNVDTDEDEDEELNDESDNEHEEGGLDDEMDNNSVRDTDGDGEVEGVDVGAIDNAPPGALSDAAWHSALSLEPLAENPVATVQPRTRKKLKWTQFEYKGKSQFLSTVEFDEALLDVAKREMGFGIAWDYQESPIVRKKDSVVTRRLHCRWYRKDECCPFVVRTEEHPSKNGALPFYEIWIADECHTEHGRDTNRAGMKRPGLDIADVAAVFNSPRKVTMKPGKLISHAIEALGPMSPGKIRKVKRHQILERKRQKKAFGDAATWGGLVKRVERYLPSNIPGGVATPETPYCLFYEVEPSTNSMIAVFSTEHFLLHAFRQAQWGFPLFLAADTAYRLTKEKNGMYPVLTINMAQEGKTICYAVISHEHTECQTKIYLAIRREVKRLVNLRVANLESILM